MIKRETILKTVAIAAVLSAVPAFAKPYKAPKPVTAAPVAAPVAEAPPAQPAQPAQDYKTFRLGFLFGVEFSQIKYSYDYTYQTGAGSPFFNGTSSKTPDDLRRTARVICLCHPREFLSH